MYNAVFCPSFDFYNNVCWYEISTALCVALTLFYWYLQFFATWYLVGLFLQFHYPIVILILPFEYARTCSSVITAYNDTVISLFHGCESFVCYLNSNYVELHNMYTLSLSLSLYSDFTFINKFEILLYFLFPVLCVFLGTFIQLFYTSFFTSILYNCNWISSMQLLLNVLCLLSMNILLSKNHSKNGI